ncbi:mannosyltransferase involved in n-linked O-linked glycosylation [Fusarium napiforme]|uniref:Mannosyltransferase involved in n-linked O-linked glycosylation n=1 Tax=Fusarium napiforme TaxID=42672 RepID=A0A8H5K4S2_9HYPO|nr:mannosyltransferase involved in n-linked O-linked glycosylation [Fusarium napiforme]
MRFRSIPIPIQRSRLSFRPVILILLILGLLVYLSPANLFSEARCNAFDFRSGNCRAGPPVTAHGGANDALLKQTPTWPPNQSLRVNATFVTLARNSDVWSIAKSIRQVEDRFNRKYGYDWVFLNEKPFDATFKRVTSALVSGKTYYGLIPPENWSFPDWIDQDKAKKVREDMAQRQIIYGDSVSYRHMCRFESGFFFRQPLMMNYDYYWRVEPDIQLYCDLDYDPFKYMMETKKKYSFVLSLPEYIETIPTLWDTTKQFFESNPGHLSPHNSMDFLSDDNGATYNKCHFWSNFEIGDLNFFRSQKYIDYFNHLDQAGGFFYERWGDRRKSQLRYV